MSFKEAEVVSSKKYGSPSEKINTKNEPWKFALSYNLENGTTVFGPNEDKIASWKFSTDAMTPYEWVVTIVTAGLYYFITRIFLRRRRTYSIIVTNQRIHVKEELFESRGFCAITKKLAENQSSFKLSSLSYLAAEEMTKRFFGITPPTVVMNLHFGQYPSLSQLPASAFVSSAEGVARAVANAMKSVYGIDADSTDPIAKMSQMQGAAAKIGQPHYAIQFAISFAYYFAMEQVYAMQELFMTALLDPAVGPRQVTGDLSARKFRFECSTVEDPKCFENMRNVIKTINDILPVRPVFSSDVKPSVTGDMLQRVKAGGKATNVCVDKAKYQKPGAFILLEDLLYIAKDEIILDVCPNNPRYTWNDFVRMWSSLGLYYLRVLKLKLSYSAAYMITNKRMIQHSIFVSGFSGEVNHSRLDMWFLDTLTGDYMLTGQDGKFFSFKPECGDLLIASTGRFGGLQLDIFTHKFAVNFLRMAACSIPVRPSYNTLCVLGKQEFLSSDEGKNAPFTAHLMNEVEQIDSSVYAYSELWCQQTFLSCGLAKTRRHVLTFTDRGIYLEDFDTNCRGEFGRVLSFLSWNKVEGVYWSNFQPYTPCTWCSSTINSPKYVSLPHGHTGAQLRISVKGANAFTFGVEIPGRYIGITDKPLNAMIDTLMASTAVGDTASAGTIAGAMAARAAEEMERLEAGAKGGFDLNAAINSAISTAASTSEPLSEISSSVKSHSREVTSVLHDATGVELKAV